MTNHHLPFSIIACQGADAQDFLHNQLTQSVNDLSTDQARVFAYCTPQGRVMADGLYWRHSEEPDTIYLMLHQSIAETLLRRLQMYVLRAKVTLELLDNSVVLGCNSPVLGAQIDAQPAAADWQLPMQWLGSTLSIQAAGTKDQPERYWLIDLSGNEHSDLKIEPHQLVTPEAWLFQEIINGWVWINEENTETFIPQNINLDILPAVNFAKGCFPGQEVVARSHYRATIRRRSVLMSAELHADIDINLDAAQALTGTDVILAPEADTDLEKARAIGRISSSTLHNGHLWALVETQLDQILNHAKLAPANYPQLTFTHQPLPFEDSLPWEKK